MNIMGNIPNTFAQLKHQGLRLLKLYLESAKLTVADKLTVLLSAGVLLVTVVVLGMFALAFLSVAMVQLLAMVLPVWACFAICAGGYAVVMLVVVLCRKSLIVDPIARFVSKLVLEHDHTDTTRP